MTTVGQLRVFPTDRFRRPDLSLASRLGLSTHNSLTSFARQGPMKSICTRALVALCTVTLCGAAAADEGMWTFNNFPATKVAQKYGDSPTQAWLDHVRLSSVRIAGG